MAKDPAALFYIDKWLTATAEMDSDVRGWYLNLILHQFDKNDLPNDIEKLAVMAGVKFSEYDKFKQVFEQVFKRLFKQNDSGRLEQIFAKEILQGRKLFQEKRSNSGKMSYFLKLIRSKFKYPKGFEGFIKENLNIDFDLKNEQVLQQVFKQNLELYINVNKDKDINKDIGINSKYNFAGNLILAGADKNFVYDWLEVRKNKKATNTETALQGFLKQVEKSGKHIDEILQICIERSWSGFKNEWLTNEKNGTTGKQTNTEAALNWRR